MTLKKNIVVIMGYLFFLVISSCSKSDNNGGPPPPPPPPANTTSVSIKSFAFPVTTTVKKGTTVKWTNNDGVTHTVTSDDGTSFNSGSIDPGASFSYTANTKGNFPYHCIPHPNMKATLVVTD